MTISKMNVMWNACFLLLIIIYTTSAQTLGAFNVDSNGISVSGLSGGGFMAVQMHVAHSKMFMGVGVVAGGPFWCAKNSLTVATNACMTHPELINVDYLLDITRNTALTNYIDPVSNMMGDRVYLYSGQADTTVVPGVMKKAEEYYLAYVDPSDIKTVYGIDSAHGFPTVEHGGQCNEVSEPEYINKCGYDTAFAILDHIYGNLQQPIYPSVTDVQGTILKFDQTEFSGGLFTPDIGLDDDGYIFVPDSCADGSKLCKLHLSLHGCKQGYEYIQDSYIKQTGYNEVAALNDIIVIYPQVKKNVLFNPNGCFDWWGYTGMDYASKIGEQVKAIRKMIERVAQL